MQLASRILLGATTLVLLGAGGVFLTHMGHGHNVPKGTEARYTAQMVDDSDVEGLAHWAELCHGRTVDELAAELKVEPTMDAVIGRLTIGLPKRSRAVVADVCRRELKAEHP